MVLEYVEGGDCGTLLKNIGGPLSFDLARSVLCTILYSQICSSPYCYIQSTFVFSGIYLIEKSAFCAFTLLAVDERAIDFALQHAKAFFQ